MSSITVAAFFTKSNGQPAMALTLAEIDLYLTRQNNSTGVDSVVWDGTQNPTEELDNIGCYARIYSGADLDTYTYYLRATYTGATVLDTDHVTGAIGRSSATLTTAGASLAVALDGTDMSIRRGDSLSVAITGLGSLVGRTKLWFTVKEGYPDADTASIIQIVEGVGGLIYLNGVAAGVPANGSITVDDAVAGDITIVLDEVETAKLKPDSLGYDVQVLNAGDVTTLTAGDVTVIADLTRAVV